MTDVPALAFLSAIDIAERIRQGEISCVDVMRDVLRRAEQSQAVLNAFATIDNNKAMLAARKADEALAQGDNIGPLHGVPVSVKDIINTAGLRTAWGSRLMVDNVPETDALAVQRLKAAGAIVFAKTTTSEFAHKLLTDSPLHGLTRNPWNLARTPGGSSGGSAAAVAAGIGPLSLATDAGASTRLPAACTGIVGLKPTLGVIPHNQVPDAFNNFIHLGVMARSVSDAALMLDVLAGAHAADPYSLAAPAPNAARALASGRLERQRIAWRPLVGNTLLDNEVRKNCEDSLAIFRELGWTVDTVEEPVENAEPAWRVLQQSHWAARFFDRINQVAPKLDPSFVEGIRAGGVYTAQQLLRATYKRTEYFRAVQSWFAKYDLVLTPTMSRPALEVTHRALDPIEISGRDAGDMRQSWAPYLNLFDLTGHPAVSVPAGWTEDGLPVGIQIVGRWHSDPLVLRAAAVLEAAKPWSQRRPPEAET